MYEISPLTRNFLFKSKHYFIIQAKNEKLNTINTSYILSKCREI